MSLSMSQVTLNKNCEATLCMQKRDYDTAIGLLKDCLIEDLPRVEAISCRGVIGRISFSHSVNSRLVDSPLDLTEWEIEDIDLDSEGDEDVELKDLEDEDFELEESKEESEEDHKVVGSEPQGAPGQGGQDSKQAKEDKSRLLEEAYGEQDNGDEDESEDEKEESEDEEESEEEEITQAPGLIRVMATYAVPINVGSHRLRLLRGHDCFYNAEGGLPFFDQAIVTASLDCVDGDVPPIIIRAILLYNMGLAFHQLAIRPGVERLYVPDIAPEDRPINVAVQCYESALMTLNLVCSMIDLDSLGQVKQDDVVLLLMAINNNLAHIHGTYFCNNIQALISVERIRYLLDYTASASISSVPMTNTVQPFYSSPTWSFFYLNVATTNPACASGAA